MRKATSILNSQNIYSILEDSKHNIWIATRHNGLYRYGNDATMANYKASKDENSLPDNFVRSVCEDSLGHLWVGTFKGLCELNPETGKIVLITDGKETHSDAAGKLVFPGFIDAHVHGGGNKSAMSENYEDIIAMAEAHLKHGTTSIVPTTLAAPIDQLKKVVLSIKKASEESKKARFATGAAAGATGAAVTGAIICVFSSGSAPP